MSTESRARALSLSEKPSHVLKTNIEDLREQTPADRECANAAAVLPVGHAAVEQVHDCVESVL